MSIFGASFTWVLLDGYAHTVVGQVGVADRDEGLLGPEQARADGDPLRLTRLVVEVDLAGGADLLAGLVVQSWPITRLMVSVPIIVEVLLSVTRGCSFTRLGDRDRGRETKPSCP